MASLVLGAAGAVAGFAIGGPVGAQIGFLAGSTIGNLLFQPKQQGPRLSDLKLQNSSYGAMTPIVFGAVRISGNVIWQTDLREHSHEEGGKGGPSVTTYSYSASFAVRVCEGPISSIRRVWANKRLIWDTRPGSSPNNLNMVVYYGSETQDPDPSMEAELGVGNVPANRGIAYVVFPDLDLTEFANTLPSLDFEVLTESHQNAHIRQTQHVNDEPVEWEHAGAGAGGAGRPAITTWGTDTIEVVDVGGADPFDVQIYDANTLEWTSSRTRSIADQFPPRLDLETPTHVIYHYYPIGMYRTQGLEIPVWVAPNFAIGTSHQNPAMGAFDVYIDSGGFPATTINIVGDAGVPPGEFIGAAVLSQDRTRLFVLTGPTTLEPGSTLINKWYEIIDSAITRTGTVSPALSINSVAFGGAATYNLGSAAAENNGRYIWAHWGAGSSHGGYVTLYEIDDATGVLALNAVAGQQDVQFDPHSTTYGGVLSFAEGYVGVVLGNTVAIFTRFPQDDSIAPTLASIVTKLSTRAGLTAADIDVTQLDEPVTGFVLASQGSARAAIEPLMQAFAFDAVESDYKVKFVKRGQDAVVTVATDDLAASNGTDLPAAVETIRTPESELPRAVYVNYLSDATDYQQGTQQARRQVTNAQSEVTLDLPIVLSDAKAKQIADATLYDAHQKRERSTIFLPRRHAALEPTDVIVAGGRRLCLLSEARMANNVLRYEAAPDHPTVSVQGVAGGVSSPGFSAPSAIPAAASTVYTYLELLDIPLVSDGDAEGFYAALGGTSPWRGASLFRSSDGGASYTAIDSQSSTDVIGYATTALDTFSGGNIFDEINAVTVQLHTGELASSNELGVLNGANTAVLGGEIIQFKNADLVGTDLYALSGLLRARRGTEPAMVAHAINEKFVLLSGVTNIAATTSEIGVGQKIKAVTVGATIAGTAATDFTMTGNAWRPYSPVQLGGGVDGSGNVTLQWNRRTRRGGAWLDYVDAQLGEASESYAVQIWNAAYTQCARVILVSAQTATYTSAQQVTDFGAQQQTIFWSVAQVGAAGIGDHANSTAPGAGASNVSPLAPTTPYGSAPTVTPAPSTRPKVTGTLGSTFGQIINPMVSSAQDWIVSFTTPAAGSDSGIISISHAYSGFTRITATISATSGGAAIDQRATISGITTATLPFFLTGNNPYPLLITTLQPSTTYYVTITVSVSAALLASYSPP